MTKRIRESDFYLDRPSALGWRGLSLLIPAIASAVGFFAFAVLAFGFTELNTLSDGFRTILVLVGAFSLAFGGEIGTLANVVEIFRKNGQCQVWDWLGLAVSAVSTLAAFVLAFAALLGVKATWGPAVQLYGPIILGVLSALDSYSGFMEFGLYLNTHDERMQEWRVQFEQFKEREWTLARQTRTRPAVQVEQPEVSSTEGLNTQNVQFPASVEHARSVKAAKVEQSKQARLDTMLDIYRVNPGAAVSTVAEKVGVSRTTVYTYLDELEQEGVLRRNGDGVEVL